jgi:hypothetical protein
MVLDQNITTLLSTVVGGLLAITGGFLATIFSQRLAEKAERRKVTCERMEELYRLSSQVKEWVKVQVLRACEIEEVTLHRKVPRWFFDAVRTQPDCPIERMEIIASLYLPSIGTIFASYRRSVLAVQHLETEMRNSMYEKSSLEAHCIANLVKDPDIQERIDNGNNIVVEFAVQLLTDFEASQERLLATLSQLAAKS